MRGRRWKKKKRWERGRGVLHRRGRHRVKLSFRNNKHYSNWGKRVSSQNVREKVRDERESEVVTLHS